MKHMKLGKYVYFFKTKGNYITTKLSPQILSAAGHYKRKTFCTTKDPTHKQKLGAQWLSGKVLDSRPRGREFEPHCVGVLEQEH